MNIDPARSHEILEEFYRKHKDQLEAYYILKYTTEEGVRKYEVLKSDDPKISEVSGLKDFSRLIYSILRIKNLKIEEIISGVESTIFEKYSVIKNKESSLKNYEIWGILTNYVPLVVRKPLMQTSAATSNNVKSRIASDRSKSADNPTGSKNATVSSKKKSHPTSLLSRYVSRKSEKKSEPKSSIMSKIKRASTEPTPNIAALDKNKKPFNDNHDIEPKKDSTLPVADPTAKKPVKSEAEAKKEEQQRKELESMFDDDSWGEDDTDMKISDNDRNEENNPEEQEVVSVRSEDTKSVISVKSETSQRDLPTTDSIIEVEPKPRFESYIDSDGFMVTNKKEDNSRTSESTNTKKPPMNSRKKTVSDNGRISKKSNGKKLMKQSTLMKFLK